MIMLLPRPSRRTQSILTSFLGSSILALGLLNLACSVSASEESAALLRKATSAFQSGDSELAIKLSDQSIAEDPKDYRGYFVRGRINAEMGNHEKAIADFDAALKTNSSEASIYHHRGSEHFKLGHIDESIADFDRYLEQAPDQAPYHWQRGIALYYAGRYGDGVKQFELHQMVNSQDVENAVWHFLCVARQDDAARARAKLIPIRGDSRVPMRQVHDLFAGEGTVEQVLEAAIAGNPSPEIRQRNLFYAHLYLGLYYEALRDQPEAKRHILKAADLSEKQNYMGAVARVHAAQFKESKERNEK